MRMLIYTLMECEHICIGCTLFMVFRIDDTVITRSVLSTLSSMAIRSHTGVLNIKYRGPVSIRLGLSPEPSFVNPVVVYSPLLCTLGQQQR